MSNKTETAKTKGLKKGIVESFSGINTIKVVVKSRKTHSLYHKVINSTRAFLAHNENNEVQLGDTVTIAPTRPYSRRKTWKLVSIDKKARQIQ